MSPVAYERTPNLYRSLLLVAGAGLSSLALAWLLWTVPSVQAQTEGPPPLPIVYQGNVYADSVPLTKDGELTVRIGDWESAAVQVQGGAYMHLVVGPPSQDYIGEEISFYMDGLDAEQRLVFPSLAEPLFETMRLDFNTPAAQEIQSTETVRQSDDDVSFPWTLAVGGALGILALLVVLAAVIPGRTRHGRAARRRNR
jgi:hypothetical protein